MNRLDRMDEKIKELEQEKELKDKEQKKKFKFLSIIKKLGKKCDKKEDFILVQYLTIKQQVDFKLCKIVGGDVVVINNKAHEIDPKAVWRHKNELWYIIREIDRKPVSNLDYDNVEKRNDGTSADVPLIKAILGAINKSNDTPMSKNVILWIIGGLVLAAVAFTFMGGA